MTVERSVCGFCPASTDMAMRRIAAPPVRVIVRVTDAPAGISPSNDKVSSTGLSAPFSPRASFLLAMSMAAFSRPSTSGENDSTSVPAWYARVSTL